MISSVIDSTLDRHFKKEAPMLTEEAERRLRKEWGDENNRTMEEGESWMRTHCLSPT